MKKILFTILILWCILPIYSMYSTSNNSNDTFIPTNSSIQKRYVILDFFRRGMNCMILEDDGSVNINYLGDFNQVKRWCLRNDTLFILGAKDHDWREFLVFTPFYLQNRRADSVMSIIKSKNLIPSEFKPYIDSLSLISLFKIHDNGDYLEPIYQCYSSPLTDDSNIIIKSISATMYNEILNFVTQYGNYNCIHFFTNGGGTKKLDWKVEYKDSNSKYRITDIERIDNQVKKVTAVNYGIYYVLINPVSYLDSAQKEVYDKDSLRAYSDWLNNVEVGKTYNLHLSRPPYYNRLPMSRFEKNNIDSVYVMDYEAYGYWFGRHITEKEHIRPLAIPAQLPIHRIYDGQPSIRIPVRQPHHRKRMRMVPYNQQ